MLNDSVSPHSALEKLCQWRNSSETQEILAYLRGKAQEADKQGRASPLLFKANGLPLPLDTVRCLQDRFIGNAEGCRELERFLDERQNWLEEAIKTLNQNLEERHG